MPKKTKPHATDKPSDLAKVVGDICKILEKLPPEHRQKALDTVKALLTSTAPHGFTNTRPPEIEAILRGRPQLGPIRIL